MAEITARNDTNSPFILYDADNEPVLFPAMGGVATGDFVMDQLQTLDLFGLIGSVVLSPDVAPANTAVPTITGTAQVGETLTATNGTWSGSPAPTYARQWKADGTNISGATATTYVPTEDDVGKTITVTVTATNAAGSASATSAATAAVIAA